MKFRCEREVLADALSLTVRASGNRTGMSPALAGVRLEVKGDFLILACTDTDMLIQFTLPVNGLQNGVSVPRARILNDIVRSMSEGAIELEVVKDDIVVRGGRSHFDVPTYNHADFPVLSPAEANEVAMPAALLADALRQVVRAASTEDTRGVLVGVLLTHEMDGLRLVATDSYRLAVRSLPHHNIIDVGERVIIPGRALGELQRLLANGDEVRVRLADPIVTFTVGNASLTTRIMNGEFPSYSQLIDTNCTNTLIVSREKLLEAIRRAKIVLPKSIGLKMQMSASGVKIQANDLDLGNTEEDIDAVYTGEPMTIGFNADLLAAGVEAVNGEEVKIETLSPNKPAIIRGVESDEYLYLLMPVRV